MFSFDLVMTERWPRGVAECTQVIMLQALLLLLQALRCGLAYESSSYSAYSEISEEKILCKSLLANYSTLGLNGRPVINTTTSMDVEFGLGLIQMDLDEKNKILSTSMWARYRWRDEYLRWDPSLFGGINSIKLNAKEIWKPDIMLYNTAETDKAEREVLAMVAFDGTVMWIPHKIFRSSCSIDVLNFPFDFQYCNMWFGSWTYGLKHIDLKLAFNQGIDLGTFESDYKESCAWDIVNNTAERKAMPEDNPAYVVLGFKLTMRRKLVFSTYILTLPCVFLACLTMVVFWLPPDRPDRTSLAMSIFGSFLVLLLILVEAAPPTASSIPTLGIYYCFNMVIIMTSIFLSTLMVNISRGGDGRKRPPRWLMGISMNVLARIFCFRNRLVLAKPQRTPDSCENEETRRLLHDKSNNGVQGGNTKLDVMSMNSRSHETCQCTCTTCPCNMHAEMNSLKKCIQTMLGILTTTSHREESRIAVRQEWQCVALAMDRLFFFIYFVAIVISLILLFPRPEDKHTGDI